MLLCSRIVKLIQGILMSLELALFFQSVEKNFEINLPHELNNEVTRIIAGDYGINNPQLPSVDEKFTVIVADATSGHSVVAYQKDCHWILC
jgi:hypothetical protein